MCAYIAGSETLQTPCLRPGKGFSMEGQFMSVPLCDLNTKLITLSLPITLSTVVPVHMNTRQHTLELIFFS